MKHLIKKGNTDVRFTGAATINVCCAISATSSRINVLGQKF